MQCTDRTNPSRIVIVHQMAVGCVRRYPIRIGVLILATLVLGVGLPKSILARTPVLPADSTHTDSLQSDTSANSHVVSTSIHGLFGEAIFAGAFFTLHGERELLNDHPGYAPQMAAPAVAAIAGAAAVTLWGNGWHLGHSSFWHVILGGLALNAIALPITARLSGSNPVTQYIRFSVLQIAGDMIAYYLWPTDER